MTAPHREPQDQAERDRIRGDLDHSYVVEAAAGTGKTTELVARIVNVLASGRATVEQIVAVTFTEKAAGELKLRLRKELEETRASAAGERRARLDEALRFLEEARVSTIHGFCADLLRERPVEARVDPQFQVLTEDQADRLYNRAFGAWLEAELQEPGEGVRRSLRRVTRRSFGTEEDEDGPIERLRRAGRALLEWRDHAARWRREPFDRGAEVARLVADLSAFVAMSESPAWSGDPLYKDTIGARTRHAAIRDGLVPADDPDGLEALLVDLHHDRGFSRPHKGSGARYGGTSTRTAVWDARHRLYEALGDFERRANADLAAALQVDLEACLARYDALKAEAGALDFVDLLLETRRVLRDNAEVRRTFRQRLTHLFVDEFQDTDPLQAEILVLLAGHPDEDANGPLDWRQVRPRQGALFVVGDPKQSIYRFRRADVGAYLDVCRWLEERGARHATLSTSFRATPPIQHLVNAAFAPLMTEDRHALQADYVALTNWRTAVAGRPAVVALPVPRPYGARHIAKASIEASLPDAVGGFLEWLFRRSGWQVSERSRATGQWQLVDVAARHVCLLFRRFTSFGQDMTRPYVQALEARDIAHLLVGGKSFHEREEVESVRAALTAIEWPDDELSVFATLRGALFAIGDEVLLEYRHHFRRFHPYQVPEHLTDRLVPVGEALTRLRQLHQQRNVRPVADTIADLLSATRAHVAFALRPGGEQALANVLHVADLARRYEADGGLSFRGFVDALADAAARAEAPEAPILEEGSDGVRLMTVHKAKGLEFPVVVLVDMTCKLSRDVADRHLDASRGLAAIRLAGWAPADLLDHEPLEVERDRQEAIRLAYVAATRARDLLVVPAVGDEPFDGGWTSPLNEAIYPAVTRRREALPATGCPPFRGDTVLERPNGDPARADTMQPGLHVFGDGPSPYEVVWWDPRTLDLDREPPGGVRHHDLIGKDAPAEVLEETLAAFRRWERARADALERGSQPSRVVATASEWAEDATLPGVQGIHVAVERVPGADQARPSGARFGALVHAILSVVPLDAPADSIRSSAEISARLLGAPADEIDAAVATVQRTLSHPTLVRARDADGVRREVPVMLELDGRLVEGVADLVFRDGGRWTVVDFKTDVEIGRQGLDRYRRQVSLYGAAVATSTGEPAEGVLLRI